MSTAPTTKISRISSDHHQWSNSFLASNQIRDEVPVINEPTEEKLTEFVKFPELALEIRRMIFKAALPLAGAVYVCITNTKGDGKGTVVEYIADRIRDSTLCSLRATCRDAKDVVDDYYIQCHFGKCTDPIFEPRIKPFVDFKHDTVVLTGCGPAIPGLWRYGYLKLSPGCSTKRHHTIELELPKIQKVAIGVHHETIGSYSDCLVYDQEDRAKFAKAVCPDAKEVTWLVKPPTVNPFQGFRYYRASDVDLTNIVWDASNAVRVEIDFEESKYGDVRITIFLVSNIHNFKELLNVSAHLLYRKTCIFCLKSFPNKQKLTCWPSTDCKGDKTSAPSSLSKAQRRISILSR